MTIKQKKILTLSKYLPIIGKGKEFRIGILVENNQESLLSIGFPDKAEIGSSLLPKPIGKTTYFNAHGKENIRKDLPKISQYKMVNATWNDWHGTSHSGIVSKRFDMYPREVVVPPSEHLCICENNSTLFACSDIMKFSENDQIRILHVINLFLEIFGECEILDKDARPMIAPKIRKLNWQVLPMGEYPWEKAKEHVRRITEFLEVGQKPVIEHRIRKITQYKPDFLAVGNGGFHGYFVLGFNNKNLYVLESVHLGNATYVFQENWEALAQLTKKDILDSNLHHSRLIHNPKWGGAVSTILGGK